MPESQYILSNQAHAKLLMHSLKYPYASVNGFLLIEDPEKKSKAGKEDSSSSIDFVDAIPLFHATHGLTPMVEAALLQVTSYCKEQNLLIGGLYCANKYFTDSSPDVFSQKIADKIVEQSSSAILLVVDHIRLAQDEADPLTPHILSDGKWRPKPGLLRLQSPSSAFELMISQGLQLQLKDFDNHLDDISNDWVNKSLNEKIQTLSEA